MGEFNVTLMGGLGNQLFQYALGRHFVELGHHVTFDRSWLRDYTDGVHCSRKPQLGLANFHVALEFGTEVGLPFSDDGFPGALRFRPEVFSLAPPRTLRGYWQCEKYFGNSLQLRCELALKHPLNSKVNEEASLIKRSENSVFVHVRRGDYLTPVHQACHGVMEMSYYQRAAHVMQQERGNVVFFVFSDDSQWCREHFQLGDTCILISGNLPPEDLYLMSLCRHAIIANSTFSWWGAWLGEMPGIDRIVIGPANWFVAGWLDARDILPPRWRRI